MHECVFWDGSSDARYYGAQIRSAMYLVWFNHFEFPRNTRIHTFSYVIHNIFYAWRIWVHAHTDTQKAPKLLNICWFSVFKRA